MQIDEIIAELSVLHDRLKGLHGALGELSAPTDIERAVEAVGNIETAAYESALIVDADGGVDDDRESLEGLNGQVERDALGVAIQATFLANSQTAKDPQPNFNADFLVSQLLTLLVGNIGDYSLVSHQAYVYREGKDENDAYIGIEIPMGRVLSEVDEQGR